SSSVAALRPWPSNPLPPMSVPMILAACDASRADFTMPDQQLYDRIGRGYASMRKADQRWASAILTAIGDAATVLNVGAGAGSYEPIDRPVMALDPSATMLRQRAHNAAPTASAARTGAGPTRTSIRPCAEASPASASSATTKPNKASPASNQTSTAGYGMSVTEGCSTWMRSISATGW